jgi:PAS domain-containing protein
MDTTNPPHPLWNMFFNGVHPEDKPSVLEHMDRASREGEACDVACRLLLPDSVKHVRIVAHEAKNESGIREFIGAVMDVTTAKQAEEKLRRSEAYLAEGQNISHTGSFGWSVLSGEIYWSEETYNTFEQDRAVKPTLELIFQRIHPDDRDRVKQTLDHAINEKTDFDIEHRLLMPDGSVKHLHVQGGCYLGSSLGPWGLTLSQHWSGESGSLLAEPRDMPLIPLATSDPDLLIQRCQLQTKEPQIRATPSGRCTCCYSNTRRLDDT